MHHDSDGLSTMMAHFAEDEKHQGAVITPIYQTSLFVFDTTEDLHRAMAHTPAGPPYHYSRVGNPTVELAERKIAALESCEACRLGGSGMAAISMGIMSCVEQGSHVVCVDTAYGPTRLFLDAYLRKFGVTVTFVDGRCTDEIFDAVRPETSLIYLESPSSIHFRLQDLPAVAQFARSRGISTMIDSTYSAGVLMKPHEMGIDLVAHSVTKYMGGHSDVTAGAICGSRDRIDRITRNELSLFGGILHPQPAFLVTRGLRTLPLRMKRHEDSANLVAAFLEDRPEVKIVHHLGLPSYAQRDLFRRDMTGSGGLFSFEPVSQDEAKIRAFCDRLRLFYRAISWGGFESLVVPLKSDYPEGRWMIRLFIGLEEPEDLIRDLEVALAELI